MKNLSRKHLYLLMISSFGIVGADSGSCKDAGSGRSTNSQSSTIVVTGEAKNTLPELRPAFAKDRYFSSPGMVQIIGDVHCTDGEADRFFMGVTQDRTRDPFGIRHSLFKYSEARKDQIIGVLGYWVVPSPGFPNDREFRPPATFPRPYPQVPTSPSPNHPKPGRWIPIGYIGPDTPRPAADLPLGAVPYNLDMKNSAMSQRSPALRTLYLPGKRTTTASGASTAVRTGEIMRDEMHTLFEQIAPESFTLQTIDAGTKTVRPPRYTVSGSEFETRHGYNVYMSFMACVGPNFKGAVDVDAAGHQTHVAPVGVSSPTDNPTLRDVNQALIAPFMPLAGPLPSPVPTPLPLPFTIGTAPIQVASIPHASNRSLREQLKAADLTALSTQWHGIKIFGAHAAPASETVKDNAKLNAYWVGTPSMTFAPDTATGTPDHSADISTNPLYALGRSLANISSVGSAWTPPTGMVAAEGAGALNAIYTSLRSSTINLCSQVAVVSTNETPRWFEPYLTQYTCGQLERAGNGGAALGAQGYQLDFQEAQREGAIDAAAVHTDTAPRLAALHKLAADLMAAGIMQGAQNLAHTALRNTAPTMSCFQEGTPYIYDLLASIPIQLDVSFNKSQWPINPAGAQNFLEFLSPKASKHPEYEYAIHEFKVYTGTTIQKFTGSPVGDSKAVFAMNSNEGNGWAADTARNNPELINPLDYSFPGGGAEVLDPWGAAPHGADPKRLPRLPITFIPSYPAGRYGPGTAPNYPILTTDTGYAPGYQRPPLVSAKLDESTALTINFPVRSRVAFGECQNQFCFRDEVIDWNKWSP